jgi:hypothetical protein
MALKKDRARVSDSIPHLPHCPLAPHVQPKHLAQRGWRKQEDKARGLVEGRLTLGSGSVNGDADARVFHGWRVECKQTVSGRYTLTQDAWERLVKGALSVGEEPLYHFEFLHPPTRPTTYMLVRADAWAAFGDYPTHTRLSGREGKTSIICEDSQIGSLAVLQPLGVLIDEQQFARLKEEIDGPR